MISVLKAIILDLYLSLASILIGSVYLEFFFNSGYSYGKFQDSDWSRGGSTKPPLTVKNTNVLRNNLAIYYKFSTEL